MLCNLPEPMMPNRGHACKGVSFNICYECDCLTCTDQQTLQQPAGCLFYDISWVDTEMSAHPG